MRVYLIVLQPWCFFERFLYTRQVSETERVASYISGLMNGLGAHEYRANHGIGLSSVRRSVEKYGGVLSLRTTEDQWLTLTILLPSEESTSP